MGRKGTLGGSLGNQKAQQLRIVFSKNKIIIIIIIIFYKKTKAKI
jgi:hypothetical protein